MLKRAMTFLVVCCLFIQSGALASPTSAASTDVRLTHVSAGVSGGATKEFIVIQNSGDEPVDVTWWCVRNKAEVSFACFEPENNFETLWLPAGAAATFVSEQLAETLPDGVFSQIYRTTSSSSGSIVGSSESLRLVDSMGVTVDTHSWSTSLSSSLMFIRDEETGLWVARTPVPIPEQGVTSERYIPDACLNIDGEQAVLPEGFVYNDLGECVDPVTIPPKPVPTLRITELFPNAIGTDAGVEFIEIYNYGDSPVVIQELQVILGVGSLTTFTLEGSAIEPGEFRSFSNSEYDYSLVNTTGRAELTLPLGERIDITDPYETPKDGESWAFIDGVWQYTNRPTPGALNEPTDLPVVLPKMAMVAEPKPCAEGQYRSPETNRCRTIQAAASPAPCQAGYYRSSETNRCRKIAVEPEVRPCPEGQERNPDTNRCRTIKQLVPIDYAVLAAETEARPEQWNIVWLASIVGGINRRLWDI